MKKILIVEDDQLVATTYKKRFSEAGWAVELAPDGLEGIKMVTAVKPDVVLLDLLMPRLDGIEVLKYIRSHPDLRNLPVVVFSNSYMTNMVENAWRAGADQCLMKASTTPPQLFDAVNKAMQKAAARVSAPVPAMSAGAAPISPLSRPVVSPMPPPQAPAGLRPQAPAQSYHAPVTPLMPRPAGMPAFVVPENPAASFAPAASPANEKPAPPEIDPEFQAQIRQLFLSSAPAKLAAMRDAASAFVQDQGSSMQLPLLDDLFRKIHSLTGNSAVAGCARIAHYASMFEAFLQELQQKPKFINVSAVRTVAQAVQTIEALFQRADERVTPPASASILVVDGDTAAGQAATMALEKAEFRTSIALDPAQALGMLATGSFALVVIAVNLPGMNGFELCAQVQALPTYAQMPMLFVTALNDFPAHSTPELLGENDVIAAPYLLMELTLKAVTQIEWARMRGAAG